MVCPKQPWFDGFNVGKGSIRQFVAMPLGSGYTVEEQITNNAEHGGIQIIVYPMKNEDWNKIKPKPVKHNIHKFSMIRCSSAGGAEKFTGITPQSAEMGLGAGGMMKQDIYKDTYGLDVWDMENSLRVFVHLVNSHQYQLITGKKSPNKAPNRSIYQSYSYPWYEYYSDEPVLPGSNTLSKIDSIASMQEKKNEKVLPDEGVKPGIYQQPILINGNKKVTDNHKW